MKKKNPEMLTTFVREDMTPSGSRPDDFSAMANMTAVLSVMALMAAYYYGIRALAVTLVCVGVCWISDALCLILRRKSLHIHDLSPIVTGLALAVMMPASVPYTVAAAAAVFAVCIAKHPFGGHGYEIVSCAAAGYIFAELSFPQAVLQYPKPFGELSAGNVVTQTLFPSFTRSSAAAGALSYSDFELLIGNFCGPMGCTFTVLVIVCAFYLISRRAISPTVFLGELGTVLLWKLFTDGLVGVKISLAGGMLVFAASILTADYALTPKNTYARLLYGIFAGVITVAVSEISSLENPAVYACIIAAPFGRLMDNFGVSRHRRNRAKSIFGASEDISETIAMIGENDDGKQS